VGKQIEKTSVIPDYRDNDNTCLWTGKESMEFPFIH